jgi:flagellar motor switch protein FliG
MSTNPRKLRKAAILVASLDRDAADIVMNQMTPLQARLVRRAMVELGSPDLVEQNDVIEDFFRTAPRVRKDDMEGMELSDGLIARVTQPSIHETSQLSLAKKGVDNQPLQFLKNASVEPLAPLLERERAQTIAVVLMHMSPESAASLLGRLPAALQVEVTHRMIELDQIEASALQALEEGVAAWLQQHAQVQNFQGNPHLAGRAAVNKILSIASDATRENMRAALPEHKATGRKDTAKQSHATRVAPRAMPSAPQCLPARLPLTFDQFCQFDSRSAANVVAEAYPEIAALALVGADAEFAESVLEQLTPVHASLIRSSMRNLGPTALADVELAQQELTRIAEQRRVRQQSSSVERSQLSVVG